MKGKTLLSLAIALSMVLAILPFATVSAAPTSIEVIFQDTGTSDYDPGPMAGTDFIVTIHITGTDPIVQWMVRISWDPAVLSYVTMSEGPFLSQGGALATVFLKKPVVPGDIPEVTCRLMEAGETSGSGDLFYITFHVDSTPFGVDSFITIYESQLVRADASLVPHDDVNGRLYWSPPPATPPHAAFTPPTSTFVYVGDTVALDASASTGGIDTLPEAHTCPITTYTWDIDIGNDGTVDFTLDGVTASFDCTGVGDVRIILTVYAPDPTSPTSPDYIDTDTETHVIHQIERPVGAAIDVYTARGGTGPGIDPVSGEPYPAPTGWSDAYGPQEEVVVYAKVTYNDEPVEYKPVAFEMKDANGESVDYRSDFTDANGIASVVFRIPWQGSDAEDLFGDWTIIGTVSIAEIEVMDVCMFKFGYLLSFRDVIVTGSPLYKGDALSVSADIQNIAFSSKDAFFTIVLYDECGVPIGLAANPETIAGEDGLTSIYTITIPSWAFVGTGTVYVNLFTAAPMDGGVPYCSEASAVFSILKTP